MTFLPPLTEKQKQVLSVVARDGQAVLFDLEVQELARLGLIDDEGSTLTLTTRGQAALAGPGLNRAGTGGHA